MSARLTVTVSAHVNESTLVRAKAHSGASGFALVSVSDGHSSVDLFFQTVADLDRMTDAVQTVRHELAALTGDESVAATAEGDQVTAHADAA